MELKPKMTFEEMACHMEENTFKLRNRVNVGIYAKERGYKTYKPMRNGRILFFYVRDNDLKHECTHEK